MSKQIKDQSSLFLLIKQNWQDLAGLTLLVFIVFANSLNGAFVSDDIPVILESKTIGTVAGAFAKPYVFMRDFLYFFIFLTFGKNPLFFHLLNIIFHIGSVCVLFLILKSLYTRRVALVASVLFAVHPIIAESVSWISGGGYPQYSYFILLSFLFFIVHQKSKSNKFYLLSIVSFILALLSSDKALPYPGILLIFIISTSGFLKNWKKIIPFFVLSGIWGSIYFLQFGDRVQTHTFNFGNSGYQVNPILFTATAITNYLFLLIWPQNLTLFHSEFGFGLINSSVSYIVFTLYILGLVISFFKYKRIFFWLSFFVIGFGVTILPLKISWIVAERYAYLASIGIFVVTAFVVERFLQKERFKEAVYAAIVIVVCLLGARTILRNMDWSSEEKLWLSTVKSTPSNPVAHSSLGLVYQLQGNIDKAGEEYVKSVTLNPQYAEGYFHLGDVYRIANRLDEAAVNYRKAVGLNPKLWQGYQALGAVYYLQKNYPLAIENTNKAVFLEKNNASLYINLGVMYFDSGDKIKAQEAFEQALRLEPENVQAQSGLQKVMNSL